uniref:Cytochrome b5 heme-binding domain-containing protein n=1 Tax=Percolomonas cosmopolitus TaxID=63605 RepID=A0A7S1KUI1_9EUKA
MTDFSNASPSKSLLTKRHSSPENTQSAAKADNGEGAKNVANNHRYLSPKRLSAQQREYWYIHGKAYDLKPFFKSHPAGEQPLILSKGRDVSEMFESAHALSNKNVHAMLKQFEVKDAVIPAEYATQRYSWKEDGTYAELARRVKKIYPSRESYKASWQWWVGLVALAFSYFSLQIISFTYGYTLMAIVAGTMGPVLGFYGLLHDASHHSVSTNPTVNKWLSIFSNHLYFWHAAVWWQHHCFAHHSHTGDPELDPDLRNGTKFIRKSPYFPLKPYHKYQKYFSYLLYLLLPNQAIGQTLSYRRAIQIGKIFGVPLIRYESARSLFESIATRSIEAFSLFLHFVYPIMCLGFFQGLSVSCCFWAGVGITYYIIVAPGHDTNVVSFKQKQDWGDQQIMHSSNFSHSNKVLTFLVGGMNYQIEHHLFPSVSWIHLPRIAKIVKEVCAERNMPYNHFDTLWDAHKAVYLNSEQLGVQRDIDRGD